MLVDCGVKANIIRCLINRGCEVIRVPWNYDYTDMEFDGLFLANGPGDPDMCEDAVKIIQKQMSLSDKPICGICMGNQLLAKAAGAHIYKLKYGHRSHNQPVRMVGTEKCFVTSQNHGYAVDAKTLGVMMGKILFDDEPENIPTAEYAGVNFVDKVSCKEIIRYNEGAEKKVVLVDCGVKANIIRCLINRGCEVIRVPWNYDYTDMEFDGLFLANGPGDPDMCEDAVKIIQKQMSLSDKPICGICMGNQLLAKAAGAHIYKLKYGHRSHNQPVRMVGTEKCFVTSQNHGYAVDAKTLGADWEELFVNMNDGSNEGIRHKSKPWFSSQFHPEACSGPVDTEFMFDKFVEAMN